MCFGYSRPRQTLRRFNRFIVTGSIGGKRLNSEDPAAGCQTNSPQKRVRARVHSAGRRAPVRRIRCVDNSEIKEPSGWRIRYSAYPAHRDKTWAPCLQKNARSGCTDAKENNRSKLITQSIRHPLIWTVVYSWGSSFRISRSACPQSSIARPSWRPRCSYSS